VCPKGANSMATSGLSFKNLGWHWMGHFYPPMHKRAKKNRPLTL